ncbi:hypothetical protein DL93DRAFT_2090192 [Clavulina sp. PMI_390]|nr:hypothetical protein DL93DRAFT_2090192 [Clavulina sp. PMI_390]
MAVRDDIEDKQTVKRKLAHIMCVCRLWHELVNSISELFMHLSWPDLNDSCLDQSYMNLIKYLKECAKTQPLDISISNDNTQCIFWQAHTAIGC